MVFTKKERNAFQIKKKIIIISSIIILFIIACIYFSQSTWEEHGGGEGSYSKDTYLDGGLGRHMYSKDTKIYYEFTIKSGGIRYELLDENGNVVRQIDATETCSGYITFDNETPVLYYEHERALSEDTIAHTNTTYYVKFSNLDKLLIKLDRLSGYRLLDDDFQDKGFSVSSDIDFPSWMNDIWFSPNSQEPEETD